jgi:hypothetical protein
MTRLFRTERFRNPAERAGRLQLFSLGVLAYAVVTVWDPTTHPGPTCCMMRLLFGLPCPLCGMTRGVSQCMRGRFVEATAFHPLAVPTFLLGLGLCLKWAVEYAWGRRIEAALSRTWRTALWTAAVAALLASWAYLLVFRREDDFAATWLGQLLHLFRP